jgi:uncharacterized membrane protein
MVDDLIDEGMSEEDAVARVGPIDKITNEILHATPLFELVRRKVKPKKRLLGWQIALIAAGSPIWISLIIVAFSIVFSLFVTMWSAVVSLWVALLSFALGAAAGSLGGLALMFTDSALSGLMICGAGIALAGLSIFMFYVCRMSTKGAAVLSKNAILGIKKLFV